MLTVLIIVVAALLGAGMAVNGKRKRQDKRDANRYLAEKLREERAAKKR